VRVIGTTLGHYYPSFQAPLEKYEID